MPGPGSGCFRGQTASGGDEKALETTVPIAGPHGCGQDGDCHVTLHNQLKVKTEDLMMRPKLRT